VSTAQAPGVTALRASLLAAAPREPASDRARLYARACEAPSAAGVETATSLAAVLSLAWGDVLAAAGSRLEDLREVVAGARRETWLWVMGERNWSQTVETLAGRAARRLGSAAAGS
jgi:hypothetical protein